MAILASVRRFLRRATATLVVLGVAGAALAGCSGSP